MKQSFLDGQLFIVICLALSVFRIYLEVIGFDFNKLPITKKLNKVRREKFHRFGFYMSIGYFLLFAPEYLMLS